MSEPNLVCKETRRLRKGLMLNRIKGVVPTEQLPPPTDNLPIHKKEMPKESSDHMTKEAYSTKKNINK